MFFTTLALAVAVFSAVYGDEIPIDDCGKHYALTSFGIYSQLDLLMYKGRKRP
jgi:hypothetical protein